MKKIFFLFIFIISSTFASENLKWVEAYKTCLSEEKRLPSIEELIKIHYVLPEGIYWSETALNENPDNYEYWVLKVEPNKSYKKGLLSKNKSIRYKCIKGKRTQDLVLNKTDAEKKFRAIYKEDVIVFPIGYLSFIGEPLHTLDPTINPYNFWQFQVRLNSPISPKYMRKLMHKTIAYDTILMGKVLSVKPLDKYGYEYIFLTTPTDMLSPYILPDEAVR